MRLSFRNGATRRWENILASFGFDSGALAPGWRCSWTTCFRWRTTDTFYLLTRRLPTNSGWRCSKKPMQSKFESSDGTTLYMMWHSIFWSFADGQTARMLRGPRRGKLIGRAGGFHQRRVRGRGFNGDQVEVESIAAGQKPKLKLSSPCNVNRQPAFFIQVGTEVRRRKEESIVPHADRGNRRPCSLVLCHQGRTFKCRMKPPLWEGETRRFKRHNCERSVSKPSILC